MNQISKVTCNGEAMLFQRIPQECDAFNHLVTLALEGTLPQSELPELREELSHLVSHD